MDQTVDSNNNDAGGTKYSLRPRTAGKKTQEVVEPVESTRKFCPKLKKETQPLSKYRRRSANARERSRMREINEAFETLRRVVSGASAVDQHGEKMTKISTLRLAMKYITALSDALLRDPDRDELQTVGSDLTTPFNDLKSHVQKSLPVPSGELVNVHREIPLALSAHSRFNSRYQHSFPEQLSLRTTKEPNSHLSFIRTCEESADTLKAFNGFSRRCAANQILVNSSNLAVPSRCDATTLNCAGSLDSYSVSEPTLRSCEHLFQEEASVSLYQFDNCHSILVSNTQSSPLQGISLEEHFITR